MVNRWNEIQAEQYEARQELCAKRTWNGVRHAAAAITIADEQYDSGELSLADLLEIRSGLADLYLQAGLEKLMIEQDECIEGSLGDVDDLDEREGLSASIEKRRRLLQAHNSDGDVEREDLTPRPPSRGYTYPTDSRNSRDERLDSPIHDDLHPGPGILYAATYPPTPSETVKIPWASETVELPVDTMDDTEAAAKPPSPHDIQQISRQPGSQATQTPLRAGILHDLTTPEGRADEYFMYLTQQTHSFIRGEKDIFQEARDPAGKKYPKVRIAILDTGFAKADKKKTRSFSHKVEECLSFFTDDATGVVDELDEVGHGTNVALQLTRVCPNATIHSYRVAKRDDKDGRVKADRTAVIRALKAAIERYPRIDIINMSFGWEYVDKEMDSVLQAAQNAGILLFASVSNFGVLGITDVLYPASSSYVIAVDAADGMGNPASFNSPAEAPYSPNIDRFSAPGEKLPGVGGQRVSGTSFASPIVAGIAALVLEFARQPPLNKDESVSKYLKEWRGMSRILRLMHRQKTAEKFMFLKPWEVLCDPKGTYGGDGGDKSRRFAVARTIIEELRKVYGYKQKIGDGVLED